jgi:hypothetical protein
MRKIFDKKGNLVEVQLEKGEQLQLMKENIKWIKSWKNQNTVVPLKKK